MNLRIALMFTALVLPGLCHADSGRWKDNGNQTLTDTFTGLVWTKHDNLKGLQWEDAKRYCDTLALAGARWRLPTEDELEGIYTGGHDGRTNCDLAEGAAYVCYVSSLFYLTGPFFWSSETAGSAGAWAFFLANHHPHRELVSPTSDLPTSVEALCVRRS